MGPNGNGSVENRKKLEKVAITSVAALLGNDPATQPNYPADIRAPQGALPGVSSVQIHLLRGRDTWTVG